jgi:tRNA threonylcarbamoyl adenosine modification protein YeaZ
LLVIEVSNPSLSDGDEGSVAFCRVADGAVEVLALELLRSGSRHDDALMRGVDNACQAAGMAPSDIARIAVSAGPGGYTGLRIAMTTAKMLGESLGAELVAVPTARVAAFGFTENQPSGASEGFIVALASKRDSAWCQPFRDCNAIGDGALCDAPALAAMIDSGGAKTLLADAHLPKEMRAAAERAGMRIVAPRLDARLCAIASIGLPTVSVDVLAPIYPREPEAVRKWREGE